MSGLPPAPSRTSSRTTTARGGSKSWRRGRSTRRDFRSRRTQAPARLAGWGCNCLRTPWPGIAVALMIRARHAREPPPSCCGDIPFNPATHGCCDGTIYDRVTQGCCDQNFFYGGEEVYTKATQCCESFLLDTKIVTKNPIPFGMIELGFCSGRAQNDRPHEFDGCSAVPSNPAGAPDTAFALEPFHPMGSSCDLGISYLPCDRHDCCYQTCSTNYLFHQAACDFEMWQGMYTVCGASQASFAVVTLCYSAADAYYVGLTVAGGFAHDKRQRQYCDCCP